MSTSNTAVKAYTLRHGTLWRTDDATPVIAVSIPTRPGHVYTVRVSALAIDQVNQSIGAYERIACFYAFNANTLFGQGLITDLLTVGTGAVTLVPIGMDIKVRITGVAGFNFSWQIATDVMECGHHIPFGGKLS